jgi:hypothetical protein
MKTKSYLVLKTAWDRPYSIEIFTTKEEAEKEAQEWLYKTLVDQGVYENVAENVAYRGDYTIQDGLINAYKYRIESFSLSGSRTLVFLDD